MMDKLTEYVFHEVQDCLSEINTRMKLSYFGLPDARRDSLTTFSLFPTTTFTLKKNLQSIVEYSVKPFNEEQRHVFDTIVGCILPGITAKNPFASVSHILPSSAKF